MNLISKVSPGSFQTSFPGKTPRNFTEKDGLKTRRDYHFLVFNIKYIFSDSKIDVSVNQYESTWITPKRPKCIVSSGGFLERIWDKLRTWWARTVCWVPVLVQENGPRCSTPNSSRVWWESMWCFFANQRGLVDLVVGAVKSLFILTQWGINIVMLNQLCFIFMSCICLLAVSPVSKMHPPRDFMSLPTRPLIFWPAVRTLRH